MHDDESTHSSGAPRSIDELQARRSRKVLIGVLRTFAIGCGAFVSSRRWLFAALLITGVLLTLISLVRPSPRHALRAPGEPDIKFDEVKSYPLSSKFAEGGFRPTLNSFDDERAGGRVPKPTLDGLAWEDGHRAGQLMPLSRRLDAMRSRHARGAWLTGTIESLSETPSAADEPQQARGQAPDRVLR